MKDCIFKLLIGSMAFVLANPASAMVKNAQQKGLSSILSGDHLHDALSKIPKPSYEQLTLQGSKGIKIAIIKEHAQASTTLKHLLEDLGDDHNNILLQNLDDSLALIQPYFALAYEEKSVALRARLQTHTLDDLAKIINAATYLDIPMVKDEAISILADKLCQEKNLYRCLEDKNGSYTFNLPPDIDRQLAQAMLKFIPHLKGNIIEHTLAIHPIQPHMLATHELGGASICFSPEGTRLAVASQDRDGSNTIKILDIYSGNVLHTFTKHNDRIFSVCYNPDGTQLASASADGTVKVWDTKTGKILQTMGHTSSVTAICYNPSGTQLASSSIGTIKIWDPSNGILLRSLPGHNSPRVLSICYSLDGKYLIAFNGIIRKWDAHSGALVHSLYETVHMDPSVCYNADGSRLLTTSGDGNFKIWDTHDDTRTSIHAGYSTHLVSANPAIAQHCAQVCFRSDTIDLLNINTGTCYCSLKTPIQSSSTFSLCHSLDGTKLASVGVRQIYIWTLLDKKIAEWYKKDIKPEQIALLQHLHGCITHGNTLNEYRYPGIAKIDLPKDLKKLPAQQSWWQRAKNKWNNLSTITKWSIGSSAAAAAGYGIYVLAHKFLPQDKK